MMTPKEKKERHREINREWMRNYRARTRKARVELQMIRKESKLLAALIDGEKCIYCEMFNNTPYHIDHPCRLSTLSVERIERRYDNRDNETQTEPF